MPSPSLPVATLLEQGASGYAAYAVQQLFEARPEARDCYPRGPFEAWKSKLSAKLAELAVAVEFESPQLFVSTVSWSRDAFRSRGVSSRDLEVALQSLQGVLQDEMTESTRTALAPYFEAAYRALESRGNAGAAGPENGRREGVPAEDDELNPTALVFLEACLAGEPDRARALVWQALDNDMTLSQVVLEVLIPVQREIGRLWHRAEVGVHEERLVSTVTEEVMVLLRSRVEPPESSARTVVGAAVQGNNHDFGVRSVLDLFAFSGWKTFNMGANLPPESMAATVLDLEADLALISVTLVTQLRTVRPTVDAIRRASDQVRIMVGGRAFQSAPDLWSKLGVDGYASSAEEAVQVADGLFR